MIDFEKLAADLAKATPGPWSVVHLENEDAEIGSGVWVWEWGDHTSGAFSDWQVATAWGPADEGMHNAALIAAAPDLARLALLVPELREALKHAALNMPHPDQCIDVALTKLNALLEGK